MTNHAPSPAFQFYPGDRLQELLPILHDNEAVGAWAKAIMYLWRNGPSSAESLGLAVGLGWDRIGFLFSEENGLLSLDWMEQMRAKTAAFSEQQRAKGRMGGRPKVASTKGKNPSLSFGLTQTKAKKSPRVEDEVEVEDRSMKHEDEEAGMGVGKPPREPEPPPTDLPFASPAFAEAWQIWETSRREKRKPLTPTARRLQLAKCAEWGEARSIAALKHSASNDWQGVYEPPASRQDPTAARKSTVMDRNAVIETNLKTAR